MILIDSDRVSFESLGVTEKALELGLLKPLENVPTKNAGDYKGVEVDVDCKENQEALVDVCDYGIKSVAYYREQAEGNPTYGKNIKGAPDVNFVREGVAKKLSKINEILDQLGLELVILDGHRSPVTQNILYDSFKEKYFEKMGIGKDVITPENKEIIMSKRSYYDGAAKKFALDFCSSAENFDPKDPKTWTIHSTGGSIDVYMLDKRSGKIVDMGEGYFDNPSDVTLTNYYEKKENKTPKEVGYMNVRRILYNVMRSEDFVNYGNECFHYSCYDQYWACVKRDEGNKVAALYGLIESKAKNLFKEEKSNEDMLAVPIDARYAYKASPSNELLGGIIGALLKAREK